MNLKKYKNRNVQICAGDFKNKTYLVDKLSKKSGNIILKDLYGLNSRKKTYPRLVHISNVKLTK